MFCKAYWSELAPPLTSLSLSLHLTSNRCNLQILTMFALADARIVPHDSYCCNSDHYYRKRFQITQQLATRREGVTWIGLPDVELSKLIILNHLAEYTSKLNFTSKQSTPCLCLMTWGDCSLQATACCLGNPLTLEDALQQAEHLGVGSCFCPCQCKVPARSQRYRVLICCLDIV